MTANDRAVRLFEDTIELLTVTIQSDEENLKKMLGDPGNILHENQNQSVERLRSRIQLNNNVLRQLSETLSQLRTWGKPASG